jgi:basic membrane lipoprotein Med (substrate-binding protein (PBP1-ABC) superfamily)
MFTKKMWQIMCLMAIFALVLTACASDEPVVEEPTAVVEEEPTEPPVETPTEVQFCVMLAVGLDQGWDRTFWDSFTRVMEDPPLGLVVHEMKLTEGLWGDEAEAAMREYAESGECDIIWPHGGYNDNIDNLKADYPDIMWVEVGSGVLEYGDNNYHFWLRCHEPSYVMGVLAGHLSETNVFGGVGTYPASDVNDSLNSFFDGAINSWYDPAAANEAAAAQIAAGAEHIDMYAETFDSCAEGGVYCYGAYNDYSEYYPTTALASFVVKWDTAIVWAIEEWVAAVTGDGFDAPEAPTFTLASDGSCDVALSEELASTLPADALAAYNEARDAILDGSLQVEFNDSLPESD